MLIRETVRRCDVCREVTPHSRRLVPLPMLLALALLVAAGWCLTLGTGPAAVGALLLWAAVFLFFRDRERCWHVRCERCRGRRRAELRATKPALDGSTEIGVW